VANTYVPSYCMTVDVETSNGRWAFERELRSPTKAEHQSSDKFFKLRGPCEVELPNQLSTRSASPRLDHPPHLRSNLPS